MNVRCRDQIRTAQDRLRRAAAGKDKAAAQRELQGLVERLQRHKPDKQERQSSLNEAHKEHSAVKKAISESIKAKNGQASAKKFDPASYLTNKAALTASIEMLKRQIDDKRKLLESRDTTDAQKDEVEKQLAALVGDLKLRTVAVLELFKEAKRVEKTVASQQVVMPMNASASSDIEVARQVAHEVAESIAHTVANSTARAVAADVAAGVASATAADVAAGVASATAASASAPPTEGEEGEEGEEGDESWVDDDLVDESCADHKNGVCDEMPYGRCAVGSDRSDCDMQCDAGEIRTANGCLICGPGTFPYPFEVSGLPDWCEPCPAGSYATVGTVNCQTCPAGTWSSHGATTCTDCFPGTYSGEGYEYCEGCPPGTASPNAGADGPEACIHCSPGHIAPHHEMSACTACEPGKFADWTGGVECYDCSQGQYSADPGAASCTQCEPGRFQDPSHSASSCDDCPVNTYKDWEGAGSCASCWLGTYSAIIGASGQGACHFCSAGTYGQYDLNTFMSTGPCESCPQGKVSEGEGVTECFDCGTHYGVGYTAVNSTTCMPPPEPKCVPGQYVHEESGAAAVCRPCSPGTFSRHAGQYWCEECPAGWFAGAHGSDECTPCPVGTYGTSWGSHSNDGCIECAAGRYGTHAGANGWEICEECPPGTFSPVVGAAALAGAGGPGRVLQSREGAVHAAPCTVCLPGTYSEEGQPECTDCLAGQFSGARATHCLDCSPGFFAKKERSHSCTACPVGKYSESWGLRDDEDCEGCWPGRVGVVAGADSPWACMECMPGRFSAAFDSGTSRRQLQRQRQEPCEACPLGFTTYGHGGAEFCTACDAGTTTEYTGAPTCTPCPTVVPIGATPPVGCPDAQPPVPPTPLCSTVTAGLCDVCAPCINYARCMSAHVPTEVPTGEQTLHVATSIQALLGCGEEPLCNQAVCEPWYHCSSEIEKICPEKPVKPLSPTNAPPDSILTSTGAMCMYDFGACLDKTPNPCVTFDHGSCTAADPCCCSFCDEKDDGGHFGTGMP
eukprot:SAG31_NODE_111_length_24443_cov_231.743685_11_plen_1020_part_00